MIPLHLTPYRTGLVFSAARLIPSSFSFIYLLNKGLSLSDVSSARLVQLLALLVLEVPCGVLADRFGPRLSLLISVFASASWLGVMVLVDNLATLIVAELLNAVSLSLFSGSFEILLRDTHKAKNPLANFGKNQSLWIAVASVFGSLFATVVSRQAAWILAAVIQALLFLLLWGDIGRSRRDSLAVPTYFSSGEECELRRIFLSVRFVPIGLWIAFTTPTLVFDVLLQFWQPIVVMFGIPSENNVLLVLISLIVMVSMSMGGALEEMAVRRWVIPTAIAVMPLLSMMVFVTDGVPRLFLAVLAICLLVIVSTAMRSRATYQVTQAVRGDVEVTAFSLVSAISRVISGLLIAAVGAFLGSVSSVIVLVLMLTALITICFLVERT